MDRDRLREALKAFEDGRLLAVDEPNKPLTYFYDAEHFPAVVAAARAVLNATEIQWCSYHSAEIVNPAAGECWDAERLHGCNPVSALLLTGDNDG